MDRLVIEEYDNWNRILDKHLNPAGCPFDIVEWDI